MESEQAASMVGQALLLINVNNWFDIPCASYYYGIKVK
jgi:hypothetical protein